MDRAIKKDVLFFEGVEEMTRGRIIEKNFVLSEFETIDREENHFTHILVRRVNIKYSMIYKSLFIYETLNFELNSNISLIRHEHL